MHLHLGLRGIVPQFLYFGAIVVFFMSAFWRPQAGIYFIVPLIPLQTLRYRLHDFPLGDKLIDITLLGVGIGVFLQRLADSKTPYTKLLWAFALYLYFCLWRGAFFLGGDLPWRISDPRFSNWKNYMVMPLLFVLVYHTIKRKDQIKWLMTLMFISAALVDRSFYSNVISRGIQHFSYDLRDGGVFGYAGVNGVGAFEAWFSIFALVVHKIYERWYSRLAILGLSAYGVYCLMFTFSRGAYAGFLCALIFYALVKKRALLFVIFALLLTWQTIVPVPVQERILMTYDNSDNQLESSAAERVTIWEDATTLIPRYPIIGTGFNTYEYMHRTAYADTHNYFIKMLVETGIIGFILFVYLLMKMTHDPWVLYRQTEDEFFRLLGIGLTASMVAIIVCNCFGDRWTYIQEAGFLWVLFACTLRGMQLSSAAEPVEIASEDPQTAGAEGENTLDGVPVADQTFFLS